MPNLLLISAGPRPTSGRPAGPSLPATGTNQVLIVQRLIELDRLFQIIAKQRVEPRMRPAADDPVIIQQLAQLLGRPPVIPRELNALVPHLSHRR